MAAVYMFSKFGRHFIKINNNSTGVLFIKHSANNYGTTSESKISKHYDIIVAGGGMVGTTFALGLAKDTRLGGKRILLLEGGPPSKYTPSPDYSNRVSALNANSAKLLTRLGAWDLIERKQPVSNMQVWDGCSDALITFDDKDTLTDMAYIVENDAILGAVAKSIEKHLDENVTILNSSRVNKIRLANMDDPHNLIELSNGDAYRCDLLIGADGANSQIRSQMGVQYLSWSYDQMGVVATLDLSEANDNTTAWQRFLPGGPVAILPLSENLSSLVWSASKTRAKELLAMSPEEFVKALNEALWKQYPKNQIVTDACNAMQSLLRSVLGSPGGVLKSPPRVMGVRNGSRAAFPLGFGHSTTYVKQGVALIGDAAHRVHPLAGQGVNLGFGDVDTLVGIIGDTVYRGANIGSSEALCKYETIRQRHIIPTMVAIEALHRLYGTELTPVVLMRSLGLQVTHALGPVKKAIIQHASGSR